jgi:hypothetical protein
VCDDFNALAFEKQRSLFSKHVKQVRGEPRSIEVTRSSSAAEGVPRRRDTFTFGTIKARLGATLFG